MGETTEDPGGTVAPLGTTAILIDPNMDKAISEVAEHSVEPLAEIAASRRRFTIAALLGIAVMALPFIAILWGPWESPNPIRKTAYEDNFYDLQARAMFHGHLWLAKGAIGIEAFVHAGREYTYFGLFPSLIRMPILAVTSSLDGKLSAPFMLVAWLLTALFATLLVWRVRLLICGPAPMGRAEAASFGILVTTVMGGTIFMFLAATPYVFAEDLAWSICLTVGSIFALLGVLERPSWARVIVSGVLILATNLDRVTTGWACVIGAVLIAGWFALGRGGRENRRWFWPVLGVALVPLVAGSAVNYAKFGVPFGVSNFDQVWTSVNAYRRRFLAANHNSEAGLVFAPSNLLAYLRPDGLRLSSVFPFITLPAAPPSALSGVLFDRRYRTASLPASTPLLFLLSCWGLITAFRPRPIGRVALTRFLLLATIIAGAALMVWGYMAPRYLADFVPFLVLASAVAMADIWRRMAARPRKERMGALSIVAALGLFSIVANIGMAITPTEEWNTGQTLHYVELQKAVSDITGHPMNGRVVRGNSLPPWAPADELYIVGACDGLYISNGENYSTVPGQQFHRTTWMTVQLGHAFQHTFRVTFNRSPPGTNQSLALVSAGPATVAVSSSRISGHGRLRVTIGLFGAGRPIGNSVSVSPGSSHQIVVITDPVKHLIQVTLDGVKYVETTLGTGGPIAVDSEIAHTSGNPPAVSVVNETGSTSGPALCRSLNQ
ncbi:MAG: hypothetical protein IVW52_17865 [Acidimicrobiales bacterium]|nr:hypothetical protein [Acidimicrobiales bacterium]